MLGLSTIYQRQRQEIMAEFDTVWKGWKWFSNDVES